MFFNLVFWRSGPQISPPGGRKGILLITIWAIRGLRGLKKHIGRIPLGGSLTFTSVFRCFFILKGPFGGSFRPRKLALNGKIRWEIDVASRNTLTTHRICAVAFDKNNQKMPGTKRTGHQTLETGNMRHRCRLLLPNYIEVASKLTVSVLHDTGLLYTTPNGKTITTHSVVCIGRDRNT